MDKRLLVSGNEERLQRNDSFRKVLPTKPSASVDSRLSMSGRMVERPSVTANRGTKPYGPFILEYALIAEYQKFRKKEIPGLYVNPAEKDPLLWYGIMFVHEGLYQGGVFRFQIHFPNSYPDGDCPRFVFNGDIFHPAVCPETGDLNVAAEFRKWRKTVNHVWQVLKYAKDIFVKIDTNAPLNTEASQMLVSDPVAFQQRANRCASYSREMLFVSSAEDDINYIKLEPYNEDIHGAVQVLKPPASSNDS